MTCRIVRAAALAGAMGLLCLIPDVALAHGFAGPRFFPATIGTDDPFAADELAVPTIGWSKDDGDGRTTSYSADFAKRIFPNFALEFGATYLRLRPPGGPTVDGFDNVSVGAKYQFATDPVRETIFSVGIDADLGRTGTSRIGAEDFTTLTPAFFFGKGFGDLADRTSLLRAFALTGSLGVAFPTKARSPDGAGGFENHPNTLKIGLALEYSLPYLQSQVRNVGLGAPFDRMVPLIELSLDTPLDRGGGPTTGTLNPGVLWAGQYIQLGAEAIVPLNRASGHALGFVAQLHFYLDDLLPTTFGRPLFGGG
jgi:hypothetical protein